jgi:lipopolysaccharide transport system ATP-binding protein
MGKTIIKVENLGKQYKLGLTRHNLLSEQIMAGAKGIARSAKRLFRNTANSGFEQKINQASPGSDRNGFIWALKEVSFEVNRGEVVGIIGRNGSGKSTLLKILTGITEPTEGKASIKGRVGSLLEVGTGFHQELTGRENIFLNGAILGMKRAEIKKNFDEIVDFAEVEKLLIHRSSGTPVGCMSVWLLQLQPTWSLRSCSWMKYSRWAMFPSRKSA